MQKTVRFMGQSSRACRWGGVLMVAAVARGAVAQKAGTLPDAPSAQAAKAPEPVAGDAIYAPLAIGRATAKRKLETYLVLSFGPRAIVSPAFAAGFRMAFPPSGYPRDWRDGAEAFGRNYGENYASKVALETGRTATAILLHEDFRYRRSRTATGFGRLVHAIGYTFVDSSDDGEHRRLAISNFVAAGAGGYTAAAILPDGYNGAKAGAKDSALRFGGLAFSNVTREYAPQIAKFFSGAHIPFPHLPIPEWYSKNLSVLQPVPVPVPVAPAAAAKPAPAPAP